MSIYKTFEAIFTVYIVLLRWTECLNCIGRDQCSCAFDDNSGVVDLTSLGNTDGSPRFKDVQSSDGTMFSYNPCKGFDEGTCNNAAACMTTNGQTLQIGDADKVQFVYDDSEKELDVSYVAGSGVVSVTTIKLICDQQARTPTLGDIAVAPGLYGFSLTSVCACKNGCSASGPTKGGINAATLGPGSIICIIFFTSLFVYCVAGSVFMKFVKKAEGKEIVPNVTFWTAIPVNIKAGFGFVVGKVRRKGGAYDSV